MVGNQVTIDVDAVRAMTAVARHDLTEGAPVGRLARSVAEGGILLRHHTATAALGTAAARLRERFDALRTLVGRLADAVDASATAMATMDEANAHRLNQIPLAEAGGASPAGGWTSRLHPDGDGDSGGTRGNSDGH